MISWHHSLDFSCEGNFSAITIFYAMSFLALNICHLGCRRTAKQRTKERRNAIDVFFDIWAFYSTFWNLLDPFHTCEHNMLCFFFSFPKEEVIARGNEQKQKSSFIWSGPENFFFTCIDQEYRVFSFSSSCCSDMMDSLLSQATRELRLFCPWSTFEALIRWTRSLYIKYCTASFFSSFISLAYQIEFCCISNAYM